jgi:hypothetical protein
VRTSYQTKNINDWIHQRKVEWRTTTGEKLLVADTNQDTGRRRLTKEEMMRRCNQKVERQERQERKKEQIVELKTEEEKAEKRIAMLQVMVRKSHRNFPKHRNIYCARNKYSVRSHF